MFGWTHVTLLLITGQRKVHESFHRCVISRQSSHGTRCGPSYSPRDRNHKSVFELNSHMCMQNIFNGVIWFVLPVLLVAANDTFAYICGFFIGKKYIQVPLISLSVSYYL